MSKTATDQVLVTRTIRQGDLMLPVAGGRTTINIDTAKNVHAVYLAFTVAGAAAVEADLLTDVGAIRVRMGGKLIYDLTAAQILALWHYFNDKYDSTPYALPGVLPLRFTPYMLPLTGQTQKFAVGMMSDTKPGQRNTFTVEVNMLAPMGGLTVDGCEVQLETDDWQPQTIGYHCRWLPYGFAWAAASQQTIDNIPHESNELAIIGYYVDHPVGTLTRLAYKVDDYERESDKPLALLQLQECAAGRKPQAAIESIDFALGNDAMSFVPIQGYVNETLQLTWGVAPTGFNILKQGLFLGL